MSTSRILRAPDEGIEPLPGGWWRLRGRGPAMWEVYLLDPRGADGGTIGAAGFAVTSSIRIEWRGDAVRWGTGPDASGSSLSAAAGLLHEPREDLYAALPLARYDRRARRFWNAVLWIARWPGGSGLIERLARRRPATDTA